MTGRPFGAATAPIISAITSAVCLLSPPAYAASPDGKIHLSYWEKWSGAEQLAMQEVVDEFNHSQDRIQVDFLSVGMIEQKTLLATAGGDPPDLAGVYLQDICAFADRNALSPLSPFMRADGQTADQFNSRYAPAYAKMGSYRGEVWALPSTPTTVALYYNKDLLRAAGYNPDQPPRTADEMTDMSKKLIRFDAAGNLTQIGFLPQLNEGWAWAIAEWFGGGTFDGKDVTIGTNPANVKAFAWMAQYTDMYKEQNIERLSSTFGQLSTPDDPFMSGKVAFVFDGVWRYSYIQQFQPGLNFGVAPWPQAVPGITDFTMADADMLIIPRGAKHPQEAWEFLRYISNPNLNAKSIDEISGVERLCFLQQKGSPLVQWSPYFTEHNPNPYIGVFRKLADSPHATALPQMGIWDEYLRNLNLAVDKVRLKIEPPEQALDECQRRVAQSWKWHQQSIELHQKDATAATP